MSTMSVNNKISFKELMKFYSAVIDRRVTLAEPKKWELKIINGDVYVKSG